MQDLFPLHEVIETPVNTFIYPLRSIYQRSGDPFLQNLVIHLKLPQHYVSWRQERKKHWRPNPLLRNGRTVVSAQLQIDQKWIPVVFDFLPDRLVYYKVSGRKVEKRGTQFRMALKYSDIKKTDVYEVPNSRELVTVVDIVTEKGVWRAAKFKGSKYWNADTFVKELWNAKWNSDTTPTCCDFQVGFQDAYENVMHGTGEYFNVDIKHVIILKERMPFGINRDDDLCSDPNYFDSVSTFEKNCYNNVLHKLFFTQFRLSGLYKMTFEITIRNYKFLLVRNVNVDPRGKAPKKRTLPKADLMQLDLEIKRCKKLPRVMNLAQVLDLDQISPPETNRHPIPIKEEMLEMHNSPSYSLSPSESSPESDADLLDDQAEASVRAALRSGSYPHLTRYFSQVAPPVGLIPTKHFSRFIVTFGSDLTVSLARLTYFACKKWFFGWISLENAIMLLRNKPYKTFLVRCSQSQAGFAISRVDSSGKIQHHNRIRYASDRDDAVLWANSATRENRIYRNFDAFLNTFSTKLCFPCEGSPFTEFQSRKDDPYSDSLLLSL